MNCLSIKRMASCSSFLSFCFVVEIGVIFLFCNPCISSFFSSTTSSVFSSSSRKTAVLFVNAQLSTIISPQRLFSLQKFSAAGLLAKKNGKEKESTDTEEDGKLFHASILFSMNLLHRNQLLGCDDIKEQMSAGKANAEELFYLYVGGKVGGCEHQTPRAVVKDLKKLVEMPMLRQRNRHENNKNRELGDFSEGDPSFRMRFYAAHTIAALAENGRRVEVDWNKLYEDVSRVVLLQIENTKEIEGSRSSSDQVDISFGFLLFALTLGKVEIEEIDDEKIEKVLKKFTLFLKNILDDENTEAGGNIGLSLSSEEEKRVDGDPLVPNLRISANILWTYGMLTSLKDLSLAASVSCNTIVSVLEYLVSYLDQQLSSSSLGSDLAPILCSLHSIYFPLSYSFHSSFPVVHQNAAVQNGCLENVFALTVQGLNANDAGNHVEVNIKFCGVMGNSLSSGGFSAALAASAWTQQKEIVFSPREKKDDQGEGHNQDDCTYVALVNVSQSSTAAKHLKAAPSVLNFMVTTPNGKKVEVVKSLLTKHSLELAECDVSVVNGVSKKRLVYSLKDEEKTSEKTAAAAKSKTTPVVITDKDVLIVDVKVKNVDTDKIASPQYSSIILSLKKSKYPVPEHLRVDRAIQFTKLASGRLQVILPLAKAVERQSSSSHPLLLPVSGIFSLEILVGDSRMKKSIRKYVLDVELKFAMQLKTLVVPISSSSSSSDSSSTTDTDNSSSIVILPSESNLFPKSLIEHQFDIPESRPHPMSSAIAFILCTFVPMVGLVMGWRWKVKVNANRLKMLMKTSSTRKIVYHWLFLMMMVGIVVIILGYYFIYNLGFAVRMLIPMSIIAGFVGNLVLCDVKTLRLNEEIQMKKKM